MTETEQIVSQFLLKTLHAVLAARVPRLLLHQRSRQPTDDAAARRRRDRWFHLALGDLSVGFHSPGFYHPSVTDPMIVDIILLDAESGVETVVERWTALCEPPPSPWISRELSSSSSSSIYRKTYQKSIVLLRSLYSVLRLLPAYRLFRQLSSSSQSSISFRVSSFAEPFSREEELAFELYAFSPVETQIGQLSVSVSYRPNLSFEASSPMHPPMIIADYVGSPAADPMRAFPSSSSPSSSGPTSFARPHSWTGAPSLARASDPRSSPVDVYGRSPIRRLSSQRKSRGFSFDEFRLSPPFSASPTPSPPTSGSNPLQSRLHYETAPVSIPQALMGKSQAHRSPNFSDPTRVFLPPQSPRSSRTDHEPPAESRSLRKVESMKVTDTYSNLHWHTGPKGLLKDGRDDSGRFSGFLSSGGSPRFGISRSSSRLSIQDDLDDIDFSCPFAVDDVDTSDSQTRNPETKQASTSASSHKSQDAAVGILVQMLRTAPPLRQDCNYSSQSSKSELNEETGASSFFVSRKTSDALEELRSYREMKEILLSQSGTPMRGPVKTKQSSG